MDFNGRIIALGVTGGIAAYRSCDFIRELFRLGADRVPCLMTKSAQAFLTPLSLEGLSREPVYTNDMAMEWDGISAGTPKHIALAQQADALVIMPATADAIARLANGLADDPVMTTAITFTNKPVLIVPAMNTRMWQHPLTQANIERLRSVAGYTVVTPTVGNLACGETGEGHLADQGVVLRQLYRALHPNAGLYQGLRALVSAGGTAEAIDPVRQITNRSSGTMGLALADELWAMGAEVTLVTTRPPTNRQYTVVPVTTARDMQTALQAEFSASDLLMMAAAVADFSPEYPSEGKMKRDKMSELRLTFVRNPDILAGLAAQKRPEQMVVGFAAESDLLRVHAGEKLRRKNLDAIVANDISRSDIGFDVPDNEVLLLYPDGESLAIPRAPKSTIARQILVSLAAQRQ